MRKKKFCYGCREERDRIMSYTIDPEAMVKVKIRLCDECRIKYRIKKDER